MANVASPVAIARDAILDTRLHQPAVAIILGSGLGGLADAVEHPTSIPYEEIPGFPKVHAAGHAGRLILGFLSGLPVVLMQGRAHRYEGCTNLLVRFPVQVMAALGATNLIVTNAAGGLNGRFQQGDLMAIDSQIDFLWDRKTTMAGNAPLAPQAVYDYSTVQTSMSIARRLCITMHSGTYIATLGPTYETRAEYAMFRAFGGDAVGMSTSVEAKQARELGMRVSGFSVITNVASTIVPVSTSHDEVVDVGNLAGPKLMQVIEQLLETWNSEPD